MTHDPASVDAIIPLEDGRLFLLPNSYELDGRNCSHPPDARGWVTQNCYLFVEGSTAVLIDTGLSIHQESMITRLEQLITPGMSLELSLLRSGEFYGLCNVRPIVEHFGIKRVHASKGSILEQTDFRPGYPQRRVGDDPFAGIEVARGRFQGFMDLGNGRVLQQMRPPLRLLTNNWLYDPGTRTLLTTDHFNYSWQQSPEGPWVAGPDSEVPSEDHVRNFLVSTRYWWLPGAQTAQMIADLDAVFDTYDVHRIGPGHGLVLEGADLVKQHVGRLRTLLEKFPHEPATGVDAGYTPRSQRAPMAAAGAR